MHSLRMRHQAASTNVMEPDSDRGCSRTESGSTGPRPAIDAIMPTPGCNETTVVGLGSAEVGGSSGGVARLEMSSSTSAIDSGRA